MRMHKLRFENDSDVRLQLLNTLIENGANKFILTLSRQLESESA